MNLTATMEDFTECDSPWRKGHPDVGSPGRGDRYHRLPDSAHGQGQPDNSRCAYEIATVGSNARTYVHGASSGIPARISQRLRVHLLRRRHHRRRGRLPGQGVRERLVRSKQPHY